MRKEFEEFIKGVREFKELIKFDPRVRIFTVSSDVTVDDIQRVWNEIDACWCYAVAGYYIDGMPDMAVRAVDRHLRGLLGTLYDMLERYGSRRDDSEVLDVARLVLDIINNIDTVSRRQEMEGKSKEEIGKYLCELGRALARVKNKLVKYLGIHGGFSDFTEVCSEY